MFKSHHVGIPHRIAIQHLTTRIDIADRARIRQQGQIVNFGEVYHNIQKPFFIKFEIREDY